jgi:hypothetical protein
MNAKTRRKIEMAKRALDFSRAHPDASPGYTAALTRLEESVARADKLAAQQRDGIAQVRAATAWKQELRDTMRSAHLRHLAQVAKVAAREAPELPAKLSLRPGQLPYLAFRTAARSMAAEAQSQKEMLVKHGLADTVLDGLAKALDQLDEAIEQGTEGRRAHVGASAELDAVADEMVQIVRVMDALNRFRFATEPELLAAWESASNVPGPFRSNGTKPATGPVAPPPAGSDVRPAA